MFIRTKQFRGVLQSLSALYNSFTLLIINFKHIISLIINKVREVYSKVTKSDGNGTPNNELLNSVTLAY
jgi:hypothetical protein